MNIRRLQTSQNDFGLQLDNILAIADHMNSDLSRIVGGIIEEVRIGGDHALVEYTNRLDRRAIDSSEIELNGEQIDSAVAAVPAELGAALEYAAERIRVYHERQLAESWSYSDKSNITLGQQVTALDKVGVYVPGGRAAYPSSVLMNAIPAAVAGVGEVIMVVPMPDDELDPAVLMAARIAGVDRVFSVGGAQAVAALAYGTETVPAVDKIVGPGNRYVAMAKRLVFGVVGIDMIAGPSEVLVVSDGTGNPDWVSMDMFAQAEHDEDARSLLITTDPRFVDKVAASMEALLPEMERASIIKASMEQNGLFILASTLDEVVDVVNRIAPEHLQLAVREAQALLPRIKHAGAIFLGHCCTEVLGDYCAGPNHVLPTGRTARFASPLGVYDFQKRSSIISCDAAAAAVLAAPALVLARAEGLTAHARSAEFRLQKP